MVGTVFNRLTAPEDAIIDLEDPPILRILDDEHWPLVIQVDISSDACEEQHYGQQAGERETTDRDNVSRVTMQYPYANVAFIRCLYYRILTRLFISTEN